MCFFYLLLFLVTTQCAYTVQHPDGFTVVEDQALVAYIDYEKCPKQYVVTFENGVVVNEGGIVTKDGKIFKSTETWRSDQQRLLKGTRNIADEHPLYFDGKLAVISSPGQENWYHWLLQVLPRLKLLVDSQVSYDKIYINNMQYDWQKNALHAVLKHLDISTDYLLLIQSSQVVEAKTLIVPSIGYIPSVHHYEEFPLWIQQFLKDCFLHEAPVKNNRKLYISRANATVRQIANEDQLAAFLKGKGFDILHLETLSVFEQARLFSEACVIIGPHGSGFANLIFAKGHTHVLEIDHKVLGDDQRSCFIGMSRQLGLRYTPFYVDTVHDDALEQDLYVDMPLFESFYDSYFGAHKSCAVASLQLRS